MGHGVTVRIPATVTYDDGTTVKVVCQQRDMVSWEQSREYVKDRPVTMGRYMAFAALRRTGQLPKTDAGTPMPHAVWEAFTEDVTADDPDETMVPTIPSPPATGALG